MDVREFTYIGSRKINEDNMACDIGKNSACFVVCDGLGGHEGGEVASETVVNAVINNIKQIPPDRENILEESVQYAQDTLLATQKNMNMEGEMKTTLVALRINENKAQWVHVGDSRLYLFRNKKVMLRTLDHSVPQMLVASGEIKEKHIRHHEDRSRLIRVMGTQWDKPKYDVSDIEDVYAGDAFLLCTDGFWELITERKMQKCLKKASCASQWIELMMEIIQKNAKGTDMDNCTAIAVII